MELTKFAQMIKNELALELSKQGSSLEELENALNSINTGEGVYKVAFLTGQIEKGIEKGMGMAAGGLMSVPEMAFKTSLTGGALAGLGMDEMDKSVEHLNKSLEREREKIHLVRRITNNLRREHGLA